jgi:hypothetical protein
MSSAIEITFPRPGPQVFGCTIPVVFTGDPGSYCVFLLDGNQVVPTTPAGPVSIGDGQSSFSGSITINSDHSISKPLSLMVCPAGAGGCPPGSFANCATPVSVNVNCIID